MLLSYAFALIIGIFAGSAGQARLRLCPLDWLRGIATMKKLLRLTLFAMAMGTGLTPTALFGQTIKLGGSSGSVFWDNDSHADIQLDPKQFADFQQRLLMAGEHAKLVAKYRTLIGRTPLLQNENIRRELQNYIIQNGLDNIRPDSPQLNLLESILKSKDPEKLLRQQLPQTGQNLAGIIEKLKQFNPSQSGTNSSQGGDALSQAIKRFTGNGNTSGGSSDEKRSRIFDRSSEPNRAFEGMPSDNESSDPLERWLLNQSDRFKNIGDRLASSPTLRQAARAVNRSTMQIDWDHLQNARNNSWLSREFMRLSKDFPTDKLLENLRFSGFQTAGDSSLTRLNLPRVNLPSLSLPAMGMPTFGAVGPPSADMDGSAFWLIGVGMLALLGWILHRRWQRSRAEQLRQETLRKGWPVPPQLVASRADLIKAFEYLSVVRLGMAARNWNHREIARALGRQTAALAFAADQLALLYELARYDPGQDEMPQDALTAARHSLVSLAGAGA